MPPPSRELAAAAAEEAKYSTDFRDVTHTSDDHTATVRRNPVKHGAIKHGAARSQDENTAVMKVMQMQRSMQQKLFGVHNLSIATRMGIDAADNELEDFHFPEQLDKWIRVVDPNSMFTLRWDSFVLGLLMYAAIVTPFSIAYLSKVGVDNDGRIEFHNLGGLLFFFVDKFVDLLFFADILITFNTGYFDWRRGIWVTNRKTIARKYASQWLIVDIISLPPYDLLGISTFLKNMRLLKVLRVARVGRIITRQAAHYDVSFAGQTVIKFMVLLVVVTHWASCLIRIVSGLDAPESWLPQYNDGKFYGNPWHE